MAGLILKITLENTHPPVWRRVEIPEGLHFGDLHEVIQILFGWENEHLHEFSTPDRQIYLLPAHTGDYAGIDGYKETDFLVEDLFEHYAWIRYTYDFGDDWRHKIELEKRTPEYQDRFARVLKARGDGFQEDSGGVYGSWGDEESCRVPFSVKETNERLEQVPLPIRQSKRDSAERISGNRKEEIANHLSRQLMQEFFQGALSEETDSWKRLAPGVYEVEDRSDPARQRLERILEKWGMFWTSPEASGMTDIVFSCGCVENEKAKEKEERASTSEQMLLPFLSESEKQLLKQSEKKKSSRKKSGNLLQVEFTDMDPCDIMERLPALDLRNFLRYLQREELAAGDKKSMAAFYRQELQGNPSLLLYPLDQGEVECLQLLCRGDKEALRHPCWSTSVYKACNIGLLDLKMTGKGEKCRIHITIPEEVRGWFSALTKTQIQKCNQNSDRILNHIVDILLVYGVCEVEMLSDLCRRLFEKKTDPQEIGLVIYWYGRMRDELMTGETRMDSAAVAWLHQMDIEKISEARAKLPEDWSYLPLTRDTVTSGKNSYLTNSYSWKRLAEYLMLYLELSEEEAVDLQEDYWRDLVSGETVDSFRQMLVDLTDPEGLQDWLMVWDVSFSAGLECPQAGLKGYSRQEYQRKTGEWPAFLPLSTGTAKKMVFIHTHLFELPLSDQLALHDMFMMPGGRGEDPRYREMDERYTRNAEVQYLLALIDREEERYEAAEERFKAIRRIAAGYSEEMFDILCLMKMEMLEQEMSRLFGEKPKKNGEKARAYLEAHPILEEEEERIMELLPGEEREAFRKISSIYKEMQSEKKNVTLRRAAPKVGRNDPCPCGSGKKYKHCCGR